MYRKLPVINTRIFREFKEDSSWRLKNIHCPIFLSMATKKAGR